MPFLPFPPSPLCSLHPLFPAVFLLLSLLPRRRAAAQGNNGSPTAGTVTRYGSGGHKCELRSRRTAFLANGWNGVYLVCAQSTCVLINDSCPVTQSVAEPGPSRTWDGRCN
ncbi:hypothetical protein DFP72DRAFT_937389 [Ephemerocybe angulata]|uniref:Secreted protein n=1 Tax=Ephemerocybe angulata TaxID=980116 RepID=A0A8H6HBG1_9AGAR|nr:hypothetical protein DFP72DRAFT_937389 [Tulosesus angulatus]